LSSVSPLAGYYVQGRFIVIGIDGQLKILSIRWFIYHGGSLRILSDILDIGLILSKYQFIDTEIVLLWTRSIESEFNLIVRLHLRLKVHRYGKNENTPAYLRRIDALL
jgi:hypothetical protein